MKIGKLSVRKQKSEFLGEHLSLECTNVYKGDTYKELFTTDGDKLKLNISKNTAKLLAKWIKENVK